MKKYKLVLFDLDGTLMDTSKGVLEAVKYTIKTMNLSALPDDLIKSFIGPPIEVSFEKYYHLPSEKVEEAAKTFREIYKKKFLFNAEIYPGMVEVLVKIRNLGYKVGVATNKRESYTLKLLEHFDLKKRFDIIYGSDEKGRLGKKEIISKCMEEAGVNAAETVMLGDTDSDAGAAETLGVDFIAVTYGFGYRNNNDVSHRFISTVSEPKGISLLIG